MADLWVDQWVVQLEALSVDLEGVAFTGIQPQLLRADLEDLLGKLQGRDDKN